jgi:hypothetical protein
MTKNTILLLTALLLAPFAMPASAAPAPSAADIDRMTDLVVKAMPFGAVFDVLAGENAKWPMQERPDAVNAEQLACLRGELSSDGYRRLRHTEVERYADTNSERFASDLALLESGSAKLFGDLVLAGAMAEHNGTKASPESIIAAASKEEIESFTSLMSDAKYSVLRKLLGMGDMFDAKASSQENEARGEDAGGALVVNLMRGAIATCNIPESAYK